MVRRRAILDAKLQPKASSHQWMRIRGNVTPLASAKSQSRPEGTREAERSGYSASVSTRIAQLDCATAPAGSFAAVHCRFHLWRRFRWNGDLRCKRLRQQELIGMIGGETPYHDWTRWRNLRKRRDGDPVERMFNSTRYGIKRPSAQFRLGRSARAKSRQFASIACHRRGTKKISNPIGALHTYSLWHLFRPEMETGCR